MRARAVEIDRAVAGHASVALERHRAALKRGGYPEPEGLDDLVAAMTEVGRTGAIAVFVITSGQEAANPVRVGRTGSYGGEHELLTQHQAADMLGVSARTIRRRLNAGTLPHTTINGVRRIRRADLEGVR